MNFREIADITLSTSRADQAEVVMFDQDDSLTRFANNCIHQNVTERNTQITIRAVVGTRVGIASSNDTRPESLKKLTARAFELAKLQPENPEFKGLPKPQPTRPIKAFDQATAECLPLQRASAVGEICSKAAAAGYTAAGSMTTAATTLAVANSLGVCAEYRTTVADCSTVVMGSSSSGWAHNSATKFETINPDQLADEAIRKVSMGANPVEFEPGEYTVVLDPYATADILAMLTFGMGALSVQESRSWLNGRMGTKIMADKITIIDDAFDPAGLPMPFDFEGMPKNVVPIVQDGVAMGPVYDSFTAGREEGKTTTGHALPPSPSDNYGPFPLNLFLRPGSDSVDSMIRSTKRGVYITRFWYTRIVHPRDAVITGMTRDGTFAIRDGEISHPIKSLRFTQSYVDALNHAEAIGSSARVLRWNGIAISVPAVKLEGFRFTSSTK